MKSKVCRSDIQLSALIAFEPYNTLENLINFNEIIWHSSTGQQKARISNGKNHFYNWRHTNVLTLRFTNMFFKNLWLVSHHLILCQN